MRRLRPRKSTIAVRAATVADRAAATRLLVEQLEEHGLPVDPDGVARAVDLALAPGGVAWLTIATVDDTAAAVLLANPIVSVEHGGAVLWIEELYVAPPRRRLGVARALVEHVAREARNSGMRALELEVLPEMAPALALWESLGFRPLERRRLSLPLGRRRGHARLPKGHHQA